MAIQIEDGTGLATAESYISVVDADAYFLARGNAAWALLTTLEKEVALRKASDFIQQTYRLKWNGYRANDTQALDWPRYYVNRKDSLSNRSNFLLNTVIPTEVKQAQCELASRASIAPLLEDLQPVVQSESVGSVSVVYGQGNRKTVAYPAVDRLLAPFLKGYGAVGIARG